MAERTLTVQLRALVQGYTAPMAKAAAAAGPLEKSLARVQRTGTAMTKVGDTLTTRVSLPLAAVGAVAIKMAIDFDSAMSKIVGLVGLSREEVDGMREDVLKLSGETTKSPQELADALFTITSAGLRGAEAMDVLEASAKASAAGLGDTRAIAEAVTASVNTYGSEVISAAEATDIFVGTARAGNFATEELTGAMGRVLPFAKAAGASLQDIGGGVALLTRSNNDANESITQMAALFRSFVKPSQQAVDILKEVGLTAEDVRTHMGEKGLVATLQMLDERLGGNREQLGKIIEDSTGFSAALQILDADAETVSGTFGAVADSAGLTEDAFSAFEQSAGFKARQAIAKLQVALIDVGNVLIPIASDIAAFAAAVASAFTALPGPVQNAVVWIGVLVAATGPLLSIGGRLVKAFGSVVTALSNFAVPAGTMSGHLTTTADGMRVATTRARGFRTAMTRLGRSLGPVGAIGGFLLFIELLQRLNALGSPVSGNLDEISFALRKMARAGRETSEWADIFDRDLKSVFETIQEADVDNMDIITRGATNLSSAFGIKDNAGEFIDALQGIDEQLAAMDPDEAAKAFEVFKEAAKAAGLSVEEITELFPAYHRALEETTVVSEEMAGKMEEAGLPVEELGTDFESLTEAVQAYNDALTAMFDPLFGMLDSLSANTEASRTLEQAEKDLTEATKEHGKGSSEAKDAQRALEQAHIDSAKSALDLEVAATTLSGAIRSGEVSVKDARAALDSWVRRGLITRETARRLGRQFDVAAGQADNLAQEVTGIPGRKNIRAKLTGVEVILTNLGIIRSDLLSLTSRAWPIKVRQTSVGPGIVAGTRQHGGPVHPNHLYLVGEEGPELLQVGGSGQVFPAHDPLTRAALMGARPAVGGVMGGGTGRVDLVMRIVGNGALARMVHQGVREGEIQLQVNGQRVSV